MKILKITLQNFRGFENKTLEFTEGFNLLVGDNGSGKTAVLDALAIGVSPLFGGLREENLREFSLDNVRRTRIIHGETSTCEMISPLSLEFVGKATVSQSFYPNVGKKDVSKEFQWSMKQINRANGGPPGRWQYRLTSPSGFALYGEGLQGLIRRGEGTALPLVGYYGTGRLWGKGEVSGDSDDTSSSRTDGYIDCLNPRSDERRMVSWFKKMEFMSLRRNETFGALVGVRQAIADCIEDCETVEVDPDFEGLQARFRDGRILPFRMLSDGYRNMLAMVADIAYRAAVLNPHLGKEAPKKISGIVLIDELDLHLHPKWQMNVVPQLKTAFPELQFIATSHSPFIIQSLRPGELVNLDDNPTGEYASQPISDIIEFVQGIEKMKSRGSRWKDMYDAAKEYYRILENGKNVSQEEKDRLKRRLDELAAPFADDPAYAAFLAMERLAAGMGTSKAGKE